MTAAAMTLAVVAIGIEFSAAGAEREVWSLALGNVAFRSRQLGANQRTMDGPFIAFIAFSGAVTLIDRRGFASRFR